jgi:hypothetical protein
MSTHLRYFFLFLILFMFLGCKHNPLDVDVSNVSTTPLTINRLEQDLFKLDSTTINAKTSLYQKKYGNFYNRFVNAIINKGGINDTNYNKNILRFVADKDMNAAYQLTQKTFSDQKITEIGNELNEMVKRFHYFFPKRKLPAYFTPMMSGFNYKVVYIDSTLAIGLDMYLNDPLFNKMLAWPNYQTRFMNSSYIPSDLAEGWLLTEFDNSEATTNLLSHTIFYGKILYAIDALLPQTQDSIKIKYTTAQLNYCEQYEKKLWGYFAEKNRLYETNMRTIQELLTDGPFTGAISKECPPRIAMWVGWQIVRSYMNQNENITVEELMNDKDAQKILNKSKYRP